MRVPIELGHLGYDQESAVIVEWLKTVGDHVERGEPLVELEVDKATIELESPRSGTLVEIVHGADEEIAVGTTIAFIEADE